MIRRTIPALVAALLIAGCARTGAGIAARVGDEVVATSQVAETVTRGYANRQYASNNPKEEYQRVVVSRLINRIVLEEARKRLGLTVTDQQVQQEFDRYVAAEGGLEQLERAAAAQGIAAEDLRDVIRDFTVGQVISDKLVADVTVTEEQLRAQYRKVLPELDVARIAHIAVADKKTADRVAKEARAGKDFAALAKRFSTDVASAPQGGDLGEVGNGSGKFEAAFMKAIFGAKRGDILGPIRAESGFEIVKVIDRRTTTFEQARDRLRRDVLAEQRTQRVTAYLNDLAKELGISVNPRFGRWDFQQGGVVATDGNGLSSPGTGPGPQDGGAVLPGQGQPGQPGQGQPGQGQPGQGQPGQPGQGQPGSQPTAPPAQ